PCVFECSWAGLGVSLALKLEESLVAVGVGDDAVPGDSILLLVGINIVIGGALDGGPVKQAALTLVIEEGTVELPNPIKVTSFDLIGLANAEPAKLADDFPIL